MKIAAATAVGETVACGFGVGPETVVADDIEPHSAMTRISNDSAAARWMASPARGVHPERHRPMRAGA